MMKKEQWDKFLASRPEPEWQGVVVFLRWLECQEKGGKERPGTFNRFLVNASHSALLRRLIDGKEPFEHPPPLNRSYPWYELMETGKATASDVREYGNATSPPVKIGINSGMWLILDKRSDDEYIVTYREGGEPYLLQRRGEWTIERIENETSSGK